MRGSRSVVSAGSRSGRGHTLKTLQLASAFTAAAAAAAAPFNFECSHLQINSPAARSGIEEKLNWRVAGEATGAINNRFLQREAGGFLKRIVDEGTKRRNKKS